jgi:hypothetical protein
VIEQARPYYAPDFDPKRLAEPPRTTFCQHCQDRHTVDLSTIVPQLRRKHWLCELCRAFVVYSGVLPLLPDDERPPPGENVYPEPVRNSDGQVVLRKLRAKLPEDFQVGPAGRRGLPRGGK